MMPALESSAVALMFWAVAGYLMGSVAFGPLVARVMGLGDLRQVGSGNIGATNVLRTGNRKAAALTLVLDAGKGAAAVLLARAVGAGDDAVQLAGLAALLGHCYPVWLRFRGGKGVATYLGLMLVFFWPAGIACCLTWLAVAAARRVSSLAALVASASGVLWLGVLGRADAMALGAVLAALVWWRHRANIARLRAGTEPRIGG